MRSFLLAVVAVIFLTACGSSATAPGAPPSVRFFAADKTTIAAGETTTLRWTIVGGESHELSYVGAVSAVDTCDVHPATSTTYVLTARNRAGEVTQSVTVAVLAIRPHLPAR
jgi:hypothetical protein